MPTADQRPNAAVRAEPRGIGTAGARDPLAREVKLLGALLGEVIVEQEGEELLDLVERIRRATIALRRSDSVEARRALAAEMDAIDLPRAEVLIRAFGLYFQLANLAEEKQRVRRLRSRARQTNGLLDGSVAEAMETLRQAGAPLSRTRASLEQLSVGLVLTAHPTEARRRTLLIALRRCYRLLDELDDPRLTPTEDAEIRRRLREAISLLWHTSPCGSRHRRPWTRCAARWRSSTSRCSWSRPACTGRSTGRSTGVPTRSQAAARDTGMTGTRPPRMSAFMEWGSWIGGDRDGNPNVTAAITRETVRIQADHVLRGYEAVVQRLSQTIAATASAGQAGSRIPGTARA